MNQAQAIQGKATRLGDWLRLATKAYEAGLRPENMQALGAPGVDAGEVGRLAEALAKVQLEPPVRRSGRRDENTVSGLPPASAVPGGRETRDLRAGTAARWCGPAVAPSGQERQRSNQGDGR